MIPIALLAQESQPGNTSQSYSMRVAGQADRALRPYSGTIVNGNCSPAGALSHVSLSPANRKKNILRFCATNASTTAFALLTDDGELWKLDENGNSEVIWQWAPTTATIVDKEGKVVRRVMKASVIGMVEGDTLNVQSLSKIDGDSKRGPSNEADPSLASLGSGGP
jgi:hypothetical protein